MVLFYTCRYCRLLSVTMLPQEPMVLFYTITKMAEPKDPNDPAAGTTGNTIFTLTEIYRGMEGHTWSTATP